MSGLMEYAKENVHSRDITINSYAAGDDEILVEGSFVDNRLKESYMLSGRKRPPGVFHHMIIRMLIKGPDLTIKDIEVEMPAAPREECLETLKSLEAVKDMKIAPGFTALVKKIAGGNKGCAHLVSLLLAMSPAVVQGYWSYRAREKIELNSFMDKERLSQYLADTCRVWRKDGPLIKKFIEGKY